MGTVINVLNVAGGMNMGGAETMQMNILRTINRKRFKMFYLCYSDRHYDYEDEINALGGKIIRMHRKTPLYDIRKIEKIIKDNSIDVVHCHTHYNSAFPVIAAKKAGVKNIIVHSHSTQDIKEGSIVKKVYATLSKRIINRYADCLMPCGEKAGESLFYNKDKIVVLHNGLILDNFEYSKVARETIRDELGIDKKTLVLGHIGRFADVKNHTFILDVFKEYCKKHSDAVLVLVGDGVLLESMKQKTKTLGISDKVRFLGLRKDSNRVYSAMDVMIFPSLYEGIPLTLVEAQMNGLPIVASDKIDADVNVTGKINFLSLSRSAKEWASFIDKMEKNRYEDSKKLYGGEYDALNEIKKLEKQYEKNR